MTGMKPGCQVKICGITNLEDAGLVAAAGANQLGVVVEVPFSPRSVPLEKAKEIFAELPLPGVALVYRISFSRLCLLIDELKPAAVQFLNPAGEILTRCKRQFPEVELWQSIHLPPAGSSVEKDAVRQLVEDSCAAGAGVIVFDTAAVIAGETRFGGTGCRSNWQLVKELVQDCRVPVYVAGGINPANVREAINMVNPAGIDLCSGVEARPGKKSSGKIRALMDAVNLDALKSKAENKEAVTGKGCGI